MREGCLLYTSNDDLVMVIVAVGDGFRQFVKCRFFVLMITIAVRTLNEQDVYKRQPLSKALLEDPDPPLSY